MSGADAETTAPVAVVDLGDETASVLPVAGRADVLLVADGAPLARAVLRTASGRLDAALVRAQLGPSAAARHARLQLLPQTPPGPGPLAATLVVRAAAPGPRLSACLRSAAALTPGPTQVVVVDVSGGCADVHRCADEHAVAYLRGPSGAGTASAGLLAAQELELEDVLLLLDGDARLDRRWAAALVGALADPVVVAATGLVLPDAGGTRTDADVGAHLGVGLDRVRLEGAAMPRPLAAVTRADVALAVRRTELLAVGGARTPDALHGVSVVEALLAAGGRVVHEPGALAFSDSAAGARPRSGGRRPSAVTLVRRRVASAAAGRPAALPVPAGEHGGGLLDRLLRSRPESADAGPADRDLPRLSVVVPSRGRRDSVVRLVRSLQEQRYDEDRVQVVVALDGDLDGSARALRSLDLPRRLEVVELVSDSRDPAQGRGAGAARNAGAARATGEVLLFLDDDVEPVDRHLLLAHARASRLRPGAAHVGLCPPRPGTSASRLEQAAHRWWADQSMRLLRREPLRCTDVATADLSVPAAAFLALGGFAALPRREDWELGQRLMTSGVPVHALPEAAVVHELSARVPTFLADVRREGAGDARMAELHPAVVGLLPLHAWRTTTPRRRRAMRALLEHRTPPAWGPAAGDAALRTLAATASSQRWHRVLNLSVTAAYWSGVGDALGGLGRLTALFEAADALAELGCGSFDAGTGQLRLPAPHEAAEVDVLLHGTRLGRLPLRCGGIPFRHERFVDAVLQHWTPQVLAGRALAAPVGSASSSAAARTTRSLQEPGT